MMHRHLTPASPAKAVINTVYTDGILCVRYVFINDSITRSIRDMGSIPDVYFPILTDFKPRCRCDSSPDEDIQFDIEILRYSRNTIIDGVVV